MVVQLSSSEVSRSLWQAAYDRSKARWSSTWISPGDFAEYLAQLGHSAPELREAAALHVEDLFLVCACARGVAPAIEVLRDIIISLAGRDAQEDLCQNVLERLLLGGLGQPRILEYGGRSSLRAWLRVVVKRTFLNQARKRSEPPADPDAIVTDARKTLSADPEVDYMRLRYAEDFKRALRYALSSLDPQQRLVLRLYAVDGATGARIAAIMGVNRVTVVRWIADIRHRLLEATRARLQAELRLSSTEFESISRLVRSDLALSISRLLDQP